MFHQKKLHAAAERAGK